ncbi:MAG: hypothetical protein ACREQL_01935 [Candidatus Binatia bacterium]
MTITRTLLNVTIAASAIACSATGRGALARGPETRYLYQLLDVYKLGAGELARIEKENAVVADYVAKAGRPDFLIEPSLTDLELVYYARSVLVHFHRDRNGTWTSSELTPLPTPLLGILPGSMRAGTPAVSGNEITGCWATTITDGSCRTCCTPPSTPAAQNCVISCKPEKS